MRTWRPALAGPAATLILCAGMVVLESQQARTITGRLLTDDTCDPVPNARVSLVPSSLGTPVVLSDADGKFTLSIPPGQFRIVASKTGYAKRDMPVAPDEGVELRLMRSASISGRVVDEIGDPVAGTRVLAGTSLSADNKLSGATATETDDRGEYRIGGLAPGTYVVELMTIGPAAVTRSVGPNQVAMGPELRETYYPSAATPTDAERLILEPGDEHSGVDFVTRGAQAGSDTLMITRIVPPGTNVSPSEGSGVIRGRVTTPDGRAVPRAIVTIFMPPDPLNSRTARADDDGRYEFRSVAAG